MGEKQRMGELQEHGVMGEWDLVSVRLLEEGFGPDVQGGEIGWQRRERAAG